MRTYTDLVPAFADQGDWTLSTVLRHHADRRPDAVFLDLPEEGLTLTYAESLAQAESIADRLAEAGAAPGDRVLVMAANSSQFLRTWLGTGVGGTIEVPINTAYEGMFLEHQMTVAAPRWAVIDDVQAAKFPAVGDPARVIEKFWVVDTGSRDEAIATLTGAGWAAAPWEELAAGARPGAVFRHPAAARPGVDLLHLRHDRPLQGRGHAARADVLLRPGGRQPPAADRRRRLLHLHAAVPRQRAVHGGLPGADRRRPAGLPAEVQRQPLGRAPAGLRRDRHQPHRRDDGLHLEAAGEGRRRRQRAADGVRRPHGQLHRRRLQGAVRHRGVHRGLRPDRDQRADPVALRRGRGRPVRRVCRPPTGSTSGWSTPRPTARWRSARSGS